MLCIELVQLPKTNAPGNRMGLHVFDRVFHSCPNMKLCIMFTQRNTIIYSKLFVWGQDGNIPL